MSVISSLMVICAEGDNEEIKTTLLADDRVEIVEEVPGKIGFVLETESTGEAERFTSALREQPILKDLILAYHNFEDEVK